MSKQFLDKDGLDIVAEQINLKPSTFTGTTSEWDAVTDKSKYQIVNLTDDVSDATEVVRNPDWSRAVSLTAAQLVSGWTAPEDGILVGYYLSDTSIDQTKFISVNGVKVAGAYTSNSTKNGGNVQVQVSQGDALSLTSSSWNNATNINFVPYKTNIIDNRIPLNYSTSEQFTGEYWIDGKKIYRKVLTGTTSSQGNSFPSNTNSVNISIGALTETIIDYKVNVNKPDAGISLKDGEVLTNVEFVAAWSRNNSHPTSPNTIAVSVGTSLTSSPIVCVVEYTKTTD